MFYILEFLFKLITNLKNKSQLINILFLKNTILKLVGLIFSWKLKLNVRCIIHIFKSHCDIWIDFDMVVLQQQTNHYIFKLII